MGKLYAHVCKTIADMAAELRGGVIAADPVLTDQGTPVCKYCDFVAACRFAEGEAGEKCRVPKKLSAEEVWALMDEEVAKDE